MLLKNRLKKCRTLTKRTQKQVADDLGISTRSYQHYELGTREPNIKMLVKIANVFNVSIDYLLERTDNPKSHIYRSLFIPAIITIKQSNYSDGFYHIINTIPGIAPWNNKEKQWFWSIVVADDMFEALNELIERSSKNSEELIKFKEEIIYKINIDYINHFKSLVLKYRNPKNNEYELLKTKYKKQINKKKKTIHSTFKKKNFSIALIANKNHGYYDFMATISKKIKNHIDETYTCTNMKIIGKIISAMTTINKEKKHTCICIVRGGGDPDELWEYNNEQLLDAIASSKIPVIIGIGHANDKILAREIANYGAITPTAAAIYLNECYEASKL